MRTFFHGLLVLLALPLASRTALAGPPPPEADPDAEASASDEAPKQRGPKRGADPVQLLRTRPTGMDEEEWRTRRRDAARQLGDERSDEAIGALVEVVETERYDAVLSIAMDSLARIGDPRAIPALQKVYADRSIDTFVREDAAKAIRALGGTPRDDARLTGRAEPADGGSSDRVVQGPQLGVMGEASAPEDTFDDDATRSGRKQGRKRRPLPQNLRARDRTFGFVVGALDLRVNTLSEAPMFADAGLAAFADYVDERHQWGWTLSAGLDASYRNGDAALAPAGNGDNEGAIQYIHQGLAVAADAHYYFGKTDFHVFGQLGLSQRLAVIRVDDFGGGTQSDLSDTRVALDVVPAAGFGWGRFLNRGSDLMVDAIVRVLETENILARALEPVDRQAIRDVVYRHSNAFSTYPRVAGVVQILRDRGYLARRAGARLLYRLRSVIEDPSYLERNAGIRARVGFLYGLPVAQDDFFQRGGDAVGAPFVQFDSGFQFGLERQVQADARGWYDVIGLGGFTVDAGVRYTRFLHSEFDDYRGQWFAGLRGGASFREYELPDNAPDEGLGHRAIALAGYAFGFQRGSEISVAANAGLDSGGFVLGAGLALEFGIARGSVANLPRGGNAPGSPPGRAKGQGKGKGATEPETRTGAPSGSVGTGSGEAASGSASPAAPKR